VAQQFADIPAAHGLLAQFHFHSISRLLYPLSFVFFPLHSKAGRKMEREQKGRRREGKGRKRTYETPYLIMVGRSRLRPKP
jgi:hypothetical protein